MEKEKTEQEKSSKETHSSSANKTPKKGDVLDINKNDKGAEGKLLAVIRISGMVKVKSEIAETLNRLRLKRKYACVLINSSNKNAMGMLNKVKHYVAFGEIDKSTLTKLIKERAQSEKGKEPNPETLANDLLSGKKLKDVSIKPFFRLHPPRKGIKSKLPYPKGVLGNNGAKINELIGRML